MKRKLYFKILPPPFFVNSENTTGVKGTSHLVGLTATWDRDGAGTVIIHFWLFALWFGWFNESEFNNEA